MQVAAGDFKAHCLGLMDEVQRHHRTITITKRGKPVAKLVPIEDKAPVPVFGFLKGHVRVIGDIVASTEEKWDANS
jgi:prevent-host-death family protein